MKLSIALVVAGMLFAVPVRAEKWGSEIAELAKKRAPGTKRVGETLEGQADKPGGRTDWHVELDPNNCYWFVGYAEERVKKISLFLWTPDAGAFTGRAATERSNERHAVMMHCPEQSGMYKVQLKIGEGFGEYVVAVYAKAAPKKVIQEDKDVLGELVAREAKSVAPGAKLVGDLYAGDDERADWYAELEAGKCYWVVAVGNDDIDELSLYLWDSDGKRVTQSIARSNKTTIGHCAKETGMFKVQIKVEDGDGPYKVGVYAKGKA